MSGHFIQLMKIAIGVRIAKPGADGIIDEEQVGKFIPPTLVVLQRMVVLESVGPNFHQCAIHRATSRTPIQPNDSALAVCDVTVLEMPEEQVAVGVGIDLDMSRVGALEKGPQVRGNPTSYGLTQHASSIKGLPARRVTSAHNNQQPNWPIPTDSTAAKMRIVTSRWYRPSWKKGGMVLRAFLQSSVGIIRIKVVVNSRIDVPGGTRQCKSTDHRSWTGKTGRKDD